MSKILLRANEKFQQLRPTLSDRLLRSTAASRGLAVNSIQDRLRSSGVILSNARSLTRSDASIKSSTSSLSAGEFHSGKVRYAKALRKENSVYEFLSGTDAANDFSKAFHGIRSTRIDSVAAGFVGKLIELWTVTEHSADEEDDHNIIEKIVSKKPFSS